MKENENVPPKLHGGFNGSIFFFLHIKGAIIFVHRVRFLEDGYTADLIFIKPSPLVELGSAINRQLTKGLIF